MNEILPRTDDFDHEQIETRAKIVLLLGLVEDLRKYQEQLRQLREDCKHKIKPKDKNMDERVERDKAWREVFNRNHDEAHSDPINKLRVWSFGSAYCAVCLRGWNGFSDEQTVFVWYCPYSPDHLCHYSHSEDHCDYCWLPEERK